MGYSILSIIENQIVQYFVTSIDEVKSLYGVDSNSMVIEAENEIEYTQIKHHDELKDNLCQTFPGYLAEEAFVEDCLNNNIIIEKINQSKSNFIQYIKHAGKISIKRPDYIIVGEKVAIEVKARNIKFYNNRNVVGIDIRDFKKYKNFQDVFNMKVYFAFYELDSEYKLIKDSLKMISINEIAKGANDNIIKCATSYMMYYESLTPGIELLNNFRLTTAST
ncbi:hypothetical protein K7J14_15000 [Treponema zuelzerae]|uniref:Uncharacterized protein n=1 Tax=Teretinema zuelzerae TaxID=156 RepID=A0AAE3JL90_9SPIR|nr:hypothetical protein [Teretinema zuelzerae]MCD1656005.1 hypothetical protein [Teretinema zuelzerae]